MADTESKGVSPVISPNSQPLPATPKVMSTAAKLEPSLSGGVALIKNNMKVWVESIKKVDDKADLIEAELELAKKTYSSRVVKIQPMKDRIIECEEKIRKNEEKVKEVTRRLFEKEQILTELRAYNKHLKKVTPEEGAVADTEAKLRKSKELYSNNYRMYQIGREKRSDLDLKLERAEIKANDMERRVSELSVKLEQHKLDDRRKKLGCRKAETHSANLQQKTVDVDQALEHTLKRKENARNRVKHLQEAVTKTSNEVESYSHDHQRIESTLTDLLLSSIREKENL
jgi:chromosome segregation ATPase